MTNMAASVRAVVYLRLCEALRQRNGHLLSRLQARHPLDLLSAHDPYATVPLKAYVSLFEDAASLLGDIGLGAVLGSRMRPADVGPVGLLFSMSSSLQKAFERMARYLPALQGSTACGTVEDGDHILWAYKIEDPAIWPRRQDAEYAIAANCELIRSCLSLRWKPAEIHFEHSAPDDGSIFQRLFDAPILYRQPVNAILLKKSDVERVNREEDRDLVHLIERHIADLLSSNAGDPGVAGRVRSFIALHIGRTPIELPGIAAHLGMTARTLQRRLSLEGHSLRSLLRDHRSQAAAVRLQSTGGSIADLASSLGYSETSAFSRAHRGWTGMGPGRARRSPPLC